jgi:predicted nuclease of restriction endonuclease-like (RecB) superfamily
MPSNDKITKDSGIAYEKTLSSIIKRVEESKHQAVTTVNKLLIELYWFIGETIMNLLDKGKWGTGIIARLSQDLKMKYPEMSGFSIRNLWNMKRFYETYRENVKLQTLSAEISWSHNVLLLNKTTTLYKRIPL